MSAVNSASSSPGGINPLDPSTRPPSPDSSNPRKVKRPQDSRINQEVLNIFKNATHTTAIRLNPETKSMLKTTELERQKNIKIITIPSSDIDKILEGLETGKMKLKLVADESDPQTPTAYKLILTGKEGIGKSGSSVKAKMAFEAFVNWISKSVPTKRERDQFLKRFEKASWPAAVLLNEGGKGRATQALQDAKNSKFIDDALDEYSDNINDKEAIEDLENQLETTTLSMELESKDIHICDGSKTKILEDIHERGYAVIRNDDDGSYRVAQIEPESSSGYAWLRQSLDYLEDILRFIEIAKQKYDSLE